MNLAPGVNPQGVHPVLWLALGALSILHRNATGRELIVTSLRRPPGDRPSRHSPPPPDLVTAADIRRHALDAAEGAEEFCIRLQRRYGAWLGVVLEPEWLTAAEIEARGGRGKVQPHVHVQLKEPAWPATL